MWPKARPSLRGLRRLFGDATPSHPPPVPALRSHIFDRLPDELLCLIFVHGALSPRRSAGRLGRCRGELSPDEFEPLRFAVIVNLVCRRWRAAALSTPIFWSKVKLTNRKKVHAAAEMLERSGTVPLHLIVLLSPSYYGPASAVEDRERDGLLYDTCIQLVKQHLGHCSSLVLRDTFCTGISPLLGLVTDRVHAPILEYINLWTRNDSINMKNEILSEPLFSMVDPPNVQYISLPWSLHTHDRISAALRNVAASLHYLELMISVLSIPESLNVLELPSLCYLLADIESFAPLRLLPLIDAPRLRTLNLKCIHSIEAPEDLVHVKRTLSSVTHCTLSLHASSTEHIMRRCYDLLPSLRMLHIADARREDIMSLIPMSDGVSGPKTPCPRLHTLIVRHSGLYPDFTWNDVHRLVSERSPSAPLHRLFLDPRAPKGKGAVHKHAKRLKAFVADVRLFSHDYPIDRQIPTMIVEECVGWNDAISSNTRA